MSNGHIRHSVPDWEGEALQAESMQCGPCTGGDVPLIGINMCAQDGTPFAHGHFDLETARQFHKLYGEAIAEAEKLGRH